MGVQSEDLDTVSKVMLQNLNQHQFYMKKNDSTHYYVEKQTTPQVQIRQHHSKRF
jgi:hypothetical protein